MILNQIPEFMSWFWSSVDIIGGFWHILKTALISSQPWNRLWFQKTSLAHFENNLYFKTTWIFHKWIIFTMSHSWVLKRMWILFYWTIRLNCLKNDFMNFSYTFQFGVEITQKNVWNDMIISHRCKKHITFAKTQNVLLYWRHRSI